MSLFNCDACGRKISTEAESCPQCGHPNRGASRTPVGLKCYACPTAATTRCQSCGTLSCALHLQSIFVHHGKGGAYELRCQSCYSSAQAWKTFGCIVGVIGLIVFAVVFFGFFWPTWNSGFPGRKEADLSPPRQASAPPWTTTVNGLTLTVDRVETKGNVFRVWMTATNKTNDDLTLPLFGYFLMIDDLGNQYKADPFASTFPREVARGATVSGSANMEGALKDNATVLKAAFTTVFGSFQVKSIAVDGIAVR